jgi:hypothetical protein
MTFSKIEIRDLISDRILYLKDLMPSLQNRISITPKRVKVELENRFSISDDVQKFDDRTLYNDEFRNELNEMLEFLQSYFRTTIRVTKNIIRDENDQGFWEFGISFCGDYYFSFEIKNNGFYSVAKLR